MRKLFNSGILSNASVQILSRLVSLILSVVLARLLGPDGFGVFSFSYTFVNVTVIFVSIGAPVFLTREIAVLSGNKNWGLGWATFSMAIQLVLIVAVATCAILAAIYHYSSEFQLTVGGSIFFGSLTLLIITSALRVTTGALRGLKRVATSQFLETVLLPTLAIFAVIAIFVAKPELLTAQVVIVLFCLVTSLVLLVAQIEMRRPFEKEHFIEKYPLQRMDLLRGVLPFSLIGAAAVLNSYTDIFMLAWFGPAAEVGLCRVASQGAVLVTFGLQIAQMIGAPSFAQSNTSQTRDKLGSEFRRLRKLSASVALVFFAVLLLAGEGVLVILFGEAFVGAYVPLVILCLGYLLNAVFGPVGILLSMCGEEGLVSRIMWISVGINIILNLALIPPLGLVGAAIATSSTIALVHPVLWLFVIRRNIIVRQGK